MLSITGTTAWREAHAGGLIGLLELSGVDNGGKSPALNDHKRAVEVQLIERYGQATRQELLAHPVMAAYRDYYKRFKKTYHVLQQVESIAQKGRQLPDVSPLVDANFAAEMATFLLTAGHDVVKLQGEVIIDVSLQGDQLTQLNGTQKTLLPGDMIMRDAGGISCSILYGQDNRSPITPATTHVLYVTYAPVGVTAEAVNGHMAAIEANVRLFAPEVMVEQSQLLMAD